MSKSKQTQTHLIERRSKLRPAAFWLRTVLLPAAYCLLPTAFCLLPSSAWANSTPVVSNVTAAQRGDDSKLVDIYYDLADADGDSCTVWVAVSDNGGTNWRVPAETFSSAIGQGISPGSNKHIVWDAGADMPGKAGSFKVRVWADDGKGPDALVTVPGGWFGFQNAPPGSYIFVDSFAIAKFETTVQEYCQFLNAEDPDGTYWHSGQEIIKKGDPGNHYYEVQAGRENLMKSPFRGECQGEIIRGTSPLVQIMLDKLSYP